LDVALNKTTILLLVFPALYPTQSDKNINETCLKYTNTSTYYICYLRFIFFRHCIALYNRNPHMRYCYFVYLVTVITITVLV